MEFEIENFPAKNVEDGDIRDLLNSVFVDGGFTDSEVAKTMFDPELVRNRGQLITAIEGKSKKLAGMIILVPANSPACKLAKNGEGELHLLGVRSEYRGHGLGKRLVEAALLQARQAGFSKLILWTQMTMLAAQSLYESFGFEYSENMMIRQREFKIYHLLIN